MIAFYRKLIISLIIIFFGYQMMAQSQSELLQLQASRQEFYFSLKVENPKILNEINRLVSVDRLTTDGCIAYANPLQFARLIDAGYEPVLLLPPSLEFPGQPMMDLYALKGTFEWDSYPTYPAYEAMMQQFAADYPNLCTLHNIGTLASGRKLLAVRIHSGNAVAKPEFLYTSTIHGDETTGYVLMLRLIDYLLRNYGTDPEVTTLVDALDLWINPNANPDGTYYGGNNTVNGARRGNVNNVDMNRNYPDPEDGQHPDGNAWQSETVYFMNFATQHNFSMAVNFHGGAEVLNYPWDTWSVLHADNGWWMNICREYVDTVHLHSPAFYMTDLNNGITNGYDWYSISGGRQDYMNYFQQCREMTLEISSTKLPPASQLPNFWNYNKRSLINYLKQATFGFHGVVTDSLTGQSIRAKVEVVGHEVNNSHVFSNAETGFYSRPIQAGVYSLKFSAEGYRPKTIPNLSISNKTKVVQDVQLAPGNIIADFSASAYNIAKGGSVNFFDNSYGQNIVSWQWQFEGAIPSTSTLKDPVNIVYPQTGSFDVQLTVTNSQGQTSTITKADLIHVSAMYIMTNGTFATCEGTFFDPGGLDNNYGNNLDMITTFVPDTEEALTRVNFIAFDVEAQSNCNYDWLKIYNGLDTNAPLLGTWCGTNSPGIIIANNGGKGLTFQFHSDVSVNKPGWVAEISCFPTVSLGENQTGGFRIYPNPTNGNLIHIKAPEALKRVTVMSLQGRIILEQSAETFNIGQLDLSDVPDGTYLVVIQTKDMIYTQKLSRIQ